MPIVSSLFVYPIKSCAGVSVVELHCSDGKLLGDRKYMVVDKEGRGLTQRTCPRLALISPVLAQDGSVTVTCSTMPALQLGAPNADRHAVRVWEYDGEGLDMGDEAAMWFSDAVERECRLVMFPPDARRPVSQEHTSIAADAQFSDGYPVLLTTVESLSELNRRLPSPVPMNRFRPNVVLRDCAPFAEDDWQLVRLPRLTLHVVKACERCVITTIDQTTLERSKEPLRTLAVFRKRGAAVCFGQNCVAENDGVIAVGDTAQGET